MDERKAIDLVNAIEAWIDAHLTTLQDGVTCEEVLRARSLKEDVVKALCNA